MELKLLHSKTANTKASCFVIRGERLEEWLKTLSQHGFSITELEIYPLPGIQPNSVWGCLVVPNKEIAREVTLQHETCGYISDRLIVPTHSKLFPSVTTDELNDIFKAEVHFMHPAIGLVGLEEPLLLEKHISMPELVSPEIEVPKDTYSTTMNVLTFQVVAQKQEEVLEELENNLVEQSDRSIDKPLKFWEKVKLEFYRLAFFTSKKGAKRKIIGQKRRVFNFMEKVLNRFMNKSSKWGERMLTDFEDLVRRNQNEVDKLLQLIEDNPSEALKYALPINNETRGVDARHPGEYRLSKIWSSLSLNSNGGQRGRTVDLGGKVNELQNNYELMARNFIQIGEFDKAAFIYLKLLKDNYRAATALEEGKLYQKAAALYLKINSKEKAAECYELGNMTKEAIELYKELNKFEKVGDLYTSLHQKEEANKYYQEVVDHYSRNSQYVKASVVAHKKMGNHELGQGLLLTGWRQKSDAYNCLNYYLASYRNDEDLLKEIRHIYNVDIVPLESQGQLQAFLRVLKSLYKGQRPINPQIRDLAYTVVANNVEDTPNLVSDLYSFNPGDKLQVQDSIRYKAGTRFN